MKKNYSYFLSFTGLIILLISLIVSCEKPQADVILPTSAAHFTNKTSANFAITGANQTYKIPVGVTTVSSTPRTVNISVSSPTGAGNAQYTLSSTTITIPAGQTIDSLTVSPVYSQYTAGRKDTLIFTITGGTDLVAAPYNKTFTLVLRGPCFEGNTVLADLAGKYANSTDPDDPKYTVTISNLVTTSATTGTGTITNLWDGLGPVTISFDWTNPADPRVSIARQRTGYYYNSSTTPKQEFSIRTTSGKVSSFSWCNQSLTLTTDLIVEDYPSAGGAALYAGSYVMQIRR